MLWSERLVRLLATPSLLATADRGRLRCTGLAVGASIVRDERGIAWVSAAAQSDLYFAVGFAQATDRLWQMDILRRRAQGRLSELFGAATVDEDLRARQLALGRMARRSEQGLSAGCRSNLESFSAGVNAAIRRMRRRCGLPPEFLLLRYRPEPWVQEHSVMIVKHLGFGLGVNLKNELFRARLAAEVPEWADRFSGPRYPADGPVTVRTPGSSPERRVSTSSHPAMDGLPAPSREWLDGLLGGEHPLGSNAWAVSGARTASGCPVVANDPHILFTQPSLWYQMGLRLHGDENGPAGYGVTVPGIPGLIAGANQCLAWGITNATVDTQDLCLLAPGAAADRWVEPSSIAVRGGAAVPVTAAGGETYVELGPPAVAEQGRYGLFWSGFSPSQEIEGCQRMWTATSYEEFRSAVATFGVPVLNVVVACRDGTIALKTSGRVPHRASGSGRAPGTFAEVAASWRRFLDFDELPEVVDPAEGYVCSANHQLVPGDAPFDLGSDWAAPYRARRIEALIEAAGRVTAEQAGHWQSDVGNGRARRVLPAILQALDGQPPAGRLASTCHRLLREWDGCDTPDQAAPWVFFRLTQELAEEWIAGRIGESLAEVMPDVTLQVDHLLLDPVARAALGGREPLAAVVGRALERASVRVARDLGDDPSGWRYDILHRIEDSHPLAKAVPALAPVFGGPPTPIGGSGHSVCLMTPNRHGEVVEGAPWRFVAELDPAGPRLWDVLRHGSSGHPLSAHYDDQTAAHTDGRLYPVTISPAPGTDVPVTDVPRRQQRVLTLVPADFARGRLHVSSMSNGPRSSPSRRSKV